jgi:SAM-dependent methyltransferase
MPARAPLTEVAQQAWAHTLRPGAWAIDATAGNGLDTEFLARSVSPGGHVFAFDIQDQALTATAGRLERAGLSAAVTLIRASHADMRAHLPCSSAGHIDLVCFNLGYLPAGDHALTTRTQTTIPALNEAIGLLRPSGVLSVIAYRGHLGAMEEAEAVAAFFDSLPDPWTCLQHEETGSSARPGPVWWMAGRKPISKG